MDKEQPKRDQENIEKCTPVATQPATRHFLQNWEIYVIKPVQEMDIEMFVDIVIVKASLRGISISLPTIKVVEENSLGCLVEDFKKAKYERNVEVVLAITSDNFGNEGEISAIGKKFNLQVHEFPSSTVTNFVNMNENEILQMIDTLEHLFIGRD